MRYAWVTDAPERPDDRTDTSNRHLERPRREPHVCRVTGREQGLVGKYDIWLYRQAFRELAPRIGFKKDN